MRKMASNKGIPNSTLASLAFGFLRNLLQKWKEGRRREGGKKEGRRKEEGGKEGEGTLGKDQ